MNKLIASSGVCSRRRADELITQGEVRVNDQEVRKLGTKVDPGKDRVTVRGKPLDCVEPSQKTHLYLVLNKPPGVISSARDPQDRTIVLDLLPESITRHRVVPVGRLDFDSEGLLVLTNDGALVNTLTHPSHEVAKIYHVLVRGRVTRAVLQIMRQGMTLAEGERLAPVSVDILHKEREGIWLQMELIQGVNRQIRRMCRDLGLRVIRLIRVQEGPVALQGLSRGQYRFLSRSEIDELSKHLSAKPMR